MLTLQADNMDQFFQWDAEGTLGTTRRYSLSHWEPLYIAGLREV